MIDYTDIDEAALIHALYHSTKPLGFGVYLDQHNLTIEDVRTEVTAWRATGASLLTIDYYHGRPLKVALDMNAKKFDERLYDRDAGAGQAARVVAGLRGPT